MIWLLYQESNSLHLLFVARAGISQVILYNTIKKIIISLLMITADKLHVYKCLWTNCFCHSDPLSDLLFSTLKVMLPERQRRQPRARIPHAWVFCWSWWIINHSGSSIRHTWWLSFLFPFATWRMKLKLSDCRVIQHKANSWVSDVRMC